MIQSFHSVRTDPLPQHRGRAFGRLCGLGMARELQQAVGVLVTSGTAVPNLAPAMAEAYHQQIPLVAFSADRPEERISQFDNQIIDQTEAFPDHSKGFCELPVDLDGESERTEALDMVQFMLESALREPRGPVHFNVLLEEPLYEPLPPGRAYESKGRLDFGEVEDDDQEETEEMEVWSDNGGSGTEPGGTLVLVGAGVPDPEMDRALQALEGRPDVAVVCEHSSNAGVVGSVVHHPELLRPPCPEGWGDLKPGR
ncbi:MAG: thiamine pyrophosphate-binding protein [Bacteroidales bacterium]